MPGPRAEQPAQKPPLTFFQIVFSGGPLGIANMVVLIALSLAAVALAGDPDPVSPWTPPLGQVPALVKWRGFSERAPASPPVPVCAAHALFHAP